MNKIQFTPYEIKILKKRYSHAAFSIYLEDGETMKEHATMCLGYICTCEVANVIARAKEIAAMDETQEFYVQLNEEYGNKKITGARNAESNQETSLKNE